MITSPALLSTYSAPHSDPLSCCTHLIPSLSLVNYVKRRSHGVILLVTYRAKANFLNPAVKAVPSLSQAHMLPVSIILSLLQLHQTTVLALSWVSHEVPGHYQQSSSFCWEGLFVLSSSSADSLSPFFSPVQPQVVNSMKKPSLIAPLISLKARPSLFCSFTTLSTWHPPSPPHNAWTSIYRDVCLNKR